MDGVLIDAKDWHFKALNKALNIFGYNISYEDHLKYFDGLPTSVKLNKLTHEQSLPSELHPLINDLKQIFTFDLGNLLCKPNFLHVMTLEKLKYDGYKLAIASNSIPETIKLFLTKANLIGYFDIILSNKDVKYSKPDPEIYIKAMKLLNESPQNCLILEDNDNGIKAAIESHANVMKINSIYDVDYYRIIEKINSL